MKGSTVYCYSLASKKHKQVTMDKVRYAGDLSQEDAPLQAFPEEEPILDEENEEQSHLSEQLNTSKQTLPENKSRDKSSPSSNKLQHKHLSIRKPDRSHRYVLRPR